MEPGGDSTLTLNTLSECVNNAVKNGYTQNFKVADNKLVTEDGKSLYKPAEEV